MQTTIDCKKGRFKNVPFLTDIKKRDIAEIKGMTMNMSNSNVSHM